MNMHKNARMTPIGRERRVHAVVGGQKPEAAALSDEGVPWPAKRHWTDIAISFFKPIRIPPWRRSFRQCIRNDKEPCR